MATLKLTYRTSKKDAEFTVLRVRYNIDATKAIYGVTETIIRIQLWNPKKEELNLEQLTNKDLRGLSIEERNELVEEIDKSNDLIQETNKVIRGLKDYIVQAFNSHSGDYTSGWLQEVINTYYQKLKPQIIEKPITLNQFTEQFIDDLETGKRLKKKSNTKVSKGYIDSIKGFRNQFNKYQYDRDVNLDFDDITMKFYRDYMSYMILDTEYAPNTAGRMIKALKTIMFAARDMKLHDNRDIDHPDFIANYVEVDNVYLTQERIDILYNMDLSENPAWEKVRDVFIVGCLTGQRVSDYKRIKSSMITKLSNGLEYIELRQEKTDKTVYIPLDWRVNEILNKYNGALPKTYDQKINDYMKKICEKAEFTESIEITEYKAGTETKISKRFCDMVKTHTARRSLCTNMQQAGCKLSEIIAISGHESEEQLKTYLKLSSKEKAMLADNGYFKRVQ